MMIRRIGALGRTYRHIQRYRDILGVLLKFGFEDLIAALKIEYYLDVGLRMISPKGRVRAESLSRPQRLRMALEELGPSFIKLGQVLSTRRDLLHGDFLAELSKLQDEVPPFPYEEVAKIVEREVPGTLADTFQSIDRDPLAAASIGQVHRARLADGEEVVVKVQRPGIRRTIEVDLEILLHLSTLMERHIEGWDVQRPTQIVEEFGRSLEKELDYRVEAANMERFAELFRDEPGVYVPKVFREALTSRLLTMEYVAGVKSDDTEALRRQGFDLKEIAGRGADLILRQIFVHGFFHADPHPGNLLILPGGAVCFLDMGSMGRLDRRTREEVADLVMGVAARNPSAAADALLKITLWEQEPDRRSLEADVAAFMDENLYRPLKDLALSRLLQRLFELASAHRLRIRPDIVLLLKALTATEGLGQKLDPDFDILQKAAPFVEKIQMERLHPRRLAEDLLDYSAEILHLAKELPAEARAVLRLARQGKLKIEFEAMGLEPLLTTQDRGSNRLSFAVVLASLIIGSSLILHAGIPPKWHDIPIIGLAGYLVAGIMGFWLLISILRRGRM